MVRRFDAVPSELPGIRRAASAYAAEHGALDPEAVALALSEAVTNVLLHAYVDAADPGEVEVVAQRHSGDGLQITVCDAGRGMIPRPNSPGLGLGLPLIASLAERFEVQARSGGGTRLCMVFAAE
jgi:anti-sigma regulatory factor (Ser/Thr protein kinase)